MTAPPKKVKKPAIVSGPEIARALEHLRDLTGDPVFDDALRALRSYGLDHALKQQSADVSAAVFGDPDEGYLAQMHYLVDPWIRPTDTKHIKSVRGAAGQVVAEQVAEDRLATHLVSATVDRLRHAYADRRATTPAPSGDLYWVEIVPVRPTTDETGAALVGPASVRWSLWWRRRWRDGDITTRRLG